MSVWSLWWSECYSQEPGAGKTGPWKGLLVASAVTHCLQQWACMRDTIISCSQAVPLGLVDAPMLLGAS